MKKVYIIHGWGGNPDEAWLQWLKNELETIGFGVYVPQMPDTNYPTIERWVGKLEEEVGNPDSETYFVGHSIGCQAIMRYIEKLPDNIKVGGAVFVAGWFDLTEETWDDNYTHAIADEWIKTPINFDRIKQHTDKFILIASDNDPYVSLANVDRFDKNLGAKIIIEKNKGHISGEDGVFELLSALEALREISAD